MRRNIWNLYPYYYLISFLLCTPVPAFTARSVIWLNTKLFNNILFTFLFTQDNTVCVFATARASFFSKPETFLSNFSFSLVWMYLWALIIFLCKVTLFPSLLGGWSRASKCGHTMKDEKHKQSKKKKMNHSFFYPGILKYRSYKYWKCLEISIFRKISLPEVDPEVIINWNCSSIRIQNSLWNKTHIVLNKWAGVLYLV